MGTLKLPGLTGIANHYSAVSGSDTRPEDAAYLVRQIHVGYGCRNGCIHCFADPPANLEQMTLDSFNRLALEFGSVASLMNAPYFFLFLGAASDPAMIVEFARYAKAWILSLPEWHKVKFYTHGWQLSNKSQRIEFNDFIVILSKYPERIATMGLSIDLFSLAARKDLRNYIDNTASNLEGFVGVLSISSLKLNVTYPVERYNSGKVYKISYWLNLASSKKSLPEDSEIQFILKQARTPEDRVCARLTSAVFSIGRKAGLTPRETAIISRDNRVPFAAGRASGFFDGRSRSESDNALQYQQEHTLQSLKKFYKGNEGIILYPDGRARIVDYLGYRLKTWLAGGQRVIPYAQIIK
jgi:hypothetical protein